ncbi:heme-binding protein [Arthrobacter sp. YD4]|uniref:GlcG/HbpS family heme-binding protein n=1 Tax=Micrococcaceae TaxID=1268 RepID=UPI0025B617CF|nr:heme-binding protein [Arthrobacter sp. YD4]MDN3936979.1 heme-binding protein [Arthrobacter sp. YD4]
MTLTLDTARTIIDQALATGAEHGFKPLTVVVLDAGGHVTAAARQDGASNNRFEIAQGKAYGALALGMGSRSIMARAEQQAYFIAAAAAAIGGRLIPVPGGVLIRDADGALLGAVGISGDTSDNDETAAATAVRAAGLTAQVD